MSCLNEIFRINELLKCFPFCIFSPREINAPLCQTSTSYLQFKEDFSKETEAYHNPLILGPSSTLRYSSTFSDDEVKETHHLIQSQDVEGHKVINQYVRERLLGIGSYGKVVLHRSLEDGQFYAVKICRKSRLRKRRVAPSETALMDVLREVAILKQVHHPNVVRLLEVIDDPLSDKLFLVLEYVNGGSLSELCGKNLPEEKVRNFFRDALLGLIYLHSHNIVHGDIKPENLLLDSQGSVRISDFGVSHMLEGNNDELRRSPGTPAFTAPECCSGELYHGKIADIWALGVSLYFLIFGELPFMGTSLSETYEKIVNSPLFFPEKPNISIELRDLLKSILTKDPEKRLTLDEISEHPWVTAGGTWESTHLKGPYLTPKQVAVRVRSFPKLRAIWI